MKVNGHLDYSPSVWERTWSQHEQFALKHILFSSLNVTGGRGRRIFEKIRNTLRPCRECLPEAVFFQPGIHGRSGGLNLSFLWSSTLFPGIISSLNLFMAEGWKILVWILSTTRQLLIVLSVCMLNPNITSVHDICRFEFITWSGNYLCLFCRILDRQWALSNPGWR